ncbi:hypothetical protein [Vibrio phage VCPH]|nr:hypothetical protein [Vibrio phage VCPH]
MLKLKLKVVQPDGQSGTRFMPFYEILMIHETNGKDVKEIRLLGKSGTLVITDEETTLSYNGKMEQVVQFTVGAHVFFESGELKAIANRLPELY